MKNTNVQNQNEKRSYLSMAAALLIAFALSLAVPYVQYLAHGTEPMWLYRIVKGLIVSVMCALIFVVARRFGVSALQKHFALMLLVGTGMMAAFGALHPFLMRVEAPVPARLIAYAYAALPVLRIVTICAWTMCLERILAEPFRWQSAALIFAGIVCTALCSPILQVVVLMILICFLAGNVKEKSEKRKPAFIIVCIFSVCLAAFLLYEALADGKILLEEWHNPNYMAQIARDVWAHARWFGTMEELSIVGGDIADFALLRLVGFLGIIPSVLIVLMLSAAVFISFKKARSRSLQTSLFAPALICLFVRIVMALLMNIGVIFPHFMTTMPLIADNVADMLCVFLLLGAATTNGHEIE